MLEAVANGAMLMVQRGKSRIGMRGHPIGKYLIFPYTDDYRLALASVTSQQLVNHWSEAEDAAESFDFVIIRYRYRPEAVLCREEVAVRHKLIDEQTHFELSDLIKSKLLKEDAQQ